MVGIMMNRRRGRKEEGINVVLRVIFSFVCVCVFVCVCMYVEVGR